MPAEAFADYLHHAVAAYAQDNVASGRWSAHTAVARSQAEFAALLPQGLATPHQHLFEIAEADTGQAVGVLWLAQEPHDGAQGAFVYDLEIDPRWRRQGHARRALQQLEPLVAEMGMTHIGLHVFAHNPNAQVLYRSLGYQVTGLNMVRRLGEPPPAA